MLKLQFRPSNNVADRLANRVLNALARIGGGGGGILLAAILLFETNDAAAQNWPWEIWDNGVIEVTKTTFYEGEGMPDPIRHFGVWSLTAGSSETTMWTLSLHNGTGSNAAVKGQDFGDLVGANASGVVTVSTSGEQVTRTLTFPIIDDDIYEGGPNAARADWEIFIFRVAGTNTSTNVSFTYDVEMRILDNDAPPPIIGGGMHALARAEALVDNQPRLIPMLRSPGAGASEFTLRASADGVDAAGGIQGDAIWGATSISRTSDGFGEHEYLLATLGARFRMSERLHLGGMLQFDRSGSEPDGAGKSGEFTGNGWMVGPYFAFRDGSNPLYFEGRLLYGRSSNDVEEYVPAQGDDTPRSASLDSERWLIQGRVEGRHHLGNDMTLIPLADFSHARDEMEAFEDSRGIAGGSRTVAVTKLQLGAEFEIPVETASGDLKMRPGLRLVVSDASNVAAVGNSTVGTGAAAEYRGRIDFGIDYKLDDDLVLGFESFYSSGRDREEFESYGAGLNLQFEF